ncbi:hypothetical protein ACQKGI_10070 [Peribacillus muralis]|uniref:hypothetical protein n=1 Tax=Peribacillus muralis TaxID=264697 RepID=UPI0038055559
MVISAFLLLGLIINIFPEKGEVVKDGIEVSETYIKDSKVLVADMTLSGNLHKRKTLEIKTLLKDNNTISVK